MGFSVSAEFPPECKLCGGNEALSSYREQFTRGWKFRTNTAAHAGYFFLHILFMLDMMFY